MEQTVKQSITSVALASWNKQKKILRLNTEISAMGAAVLLSFPSFRRHEGGGGRTNIAN